MELIHQKTKAKYIHLANDSHENAFCTAFKTVPTDSTGVAHILEHTVLTGSQKYPVADPFFSMLKRSMQTFMNAFTANDWTAYPFCTQNEKDYYNLMSVYTDAVFFPIISEDKFKQEGWRFELADDKLVYKGIVYNEMKGSMSNPERVMEEAMNKALYPTTTYGYNSGGSPEEITQLSYEGLKAFHARYYHPSNCFFYSYGNFSLEKHLSFLDENILQKFKAIDPQTDLQNEPRWDSPKKTTCAYPVSSDEEIEQKYQACIFWLLCDIKDSVLVTSFELLDEILLSSPASPLRKALLESGMGSDLSDGSEYNSDFLDTCFACGLKDIKQSDAQKIEDLIFDTLKQLVEQGIDPELIESAIQKQEFSQKEISNSPYPYGLKQFLRVIGTWIHQGEVINCLDVDRDMDIVKEQIKAGNYFEKLIQKHLLENPHRVSFLLTPDKELANKQIAEVEKHLQKLQKELSEEQKKQIINDTEEFNKAEKEKEDISCLPTMELSDIPRTVDIVTNTYDEKNNIYSFEQATNGLLYLTINFDLKNIGQTDMDLIPILCYLLPKIGTQNKNFAELAKALNLHTGGINLLPYAISKQDSTDDYISAIALSAKCLVRKKDKMFELVEELLTAPDFSDLKMLKNFLNEYKARSENQVVSNGHTMAMSLSASTLKPTKHLNECWHGLTNLDFIKNLFNKIDEDKLNQLAERLSALSRQIFKQANIEFAIIGEKKEIAQAQTNIHKLRKKITSDSVETHEIELEAKNHFLGRSTATAVTFSAMAFPVVTFSHQDAPALTVINKLLGRIYLHREIREKGGAYGGFSRYDSDEGVFYFSTYRDPHLVRTLSVYDSAMDYIKSGKYSDNDIKEAIMQACSDSDRPDSPAEKARRAFFRELTGKSDSARLQFKKSLLSITKDQVVAVANKYFDRKWTDCSVAVIASPEKLQTANTKLARQLEIKKI